MKLFHVQYSCLDYYCDEMHTVGIYSTVLLAEKGIIEHVKANPQYRAHYEYKVKVRELDSTELAHLV